MKHSIWQYLEKHWKILLNIISVSVLIILIFAIRHDLVSTFDNLARVRAWVLLLIIPIEVLNYDAQARLYRSLFRLVGNDIAYKTLYKVSLELNFINSVLPSAGFSGVSYFGVRLRSSDITAGKAAVVQMIKLVMIFLSFEILLLLGLVFMAVGGHINDITILVASSLTTLMVVGTLGFMAIIGSTERINATFATVTKSLNWIIHLVRPTHPETIKIDRFRHTVDELHKNYRLIHDNYKQLKKPLAYAFVANLTEVLAIYAVYAAFGHLVNFGAVTLAYAVANFAGLISVLPGGLGVFEALMTAVLVAAGVPLRISIPVTVMYRVLNTLIQIPPGYYFYHKALLKIGTQHKETAS
jgi:uncharacterized protein (TIRG00374 family)